jgi:hypothetical protein
MAAPRASTADGVEIFGEGLEGPLVAQTGAERAGAHALDLLEGADDEVAVLGPGGRHAEAAIAHHDGGDAVPGRHGQHTIPQHLGVVVRVDVDEPGSHDTIGGVDRGGRLHVGQRRR